MFKDFYLILCQKAIEIQQLWKPSYWDKCFCIHEKKEVVLSGYETDGGYYGHQIDNTYKDNILCYDEDEGKKNHIWLPTQLQLQDLLPQKVSEKEKIVTKKEFWGSGEGSKYYITLNTINEFMGFWYENIDYIRNHRFNTMEQIWLLFVMKERYNKIWKEQDWIISEVNNEKT